MPNSFNFPSDEEKRNKLIKLGLNPDEYEWVSPEEASKNNNVVSGGDREEAKSSGVKAAMTSARRNIGGSAGALAVISASTPLNTAIGSVSGPAAIATVPIAMLIEGAIGAAGGNLAQEKIEPALRGETEKETKGRIAEEDKLMQEHPIASFTGGLIPQAIAMRPSVSTTKNAAKGIASLLREGGELSVAQKLALQNVGIGAATSVAGDVGERAWKGGMEGVKNITPKDILLDIAAGGALHKPTKLVGQKIFRLHPDIDVSPKDSYEPMTLRENYNVEVPQERKVYTESLTDSLGLKKEPVNSIIDRDAKNEPIPLQNIVTEGGAKQIELPVGDVQLLINKLNSKEPLTPQEADFHKAMAEKVSQIYEDAGANKVPVVKDSATGKALTENQLRIMKDSLVKSIKDNQVKFQDSSKSPDVNVGSKKTSLKDVLEEVYTKYEPKLTKDKDGNISKVKWEKRKEPLAPLTEETVAQGRPTFSGIEHTFTPEESNLIRREGLSVYLDSNLYNPNSGKVAAGAAHTKSPDRLTAINPKAVVDTTVAHETAHHRIAEMLNDKKQSKYAEKWLNKFNGDEELLVENAAKAWLNRTSENGLRSFARDLISSTKSKLGMASHDDVARLLMQKINKDPSFAERQMIRDSANRSVRGTSLTNVREDVKFQEGDNKNYHDFVPAIKTGDGNIIKGTKGKIHNDIVFSQPREWILDNIDSHERGFINEKDGKFYSRSEASNALGEKFPLNSERLRELQDNSDVKFQDSPFETSTVKLLNNPEELRLTKDKNGLYDSNNILGIIRNKIPSSEYAVLKDLGMDEFITSKKKISDEEIKNWVSEHAPKVEVHSYGQEGKVSPEKAELDDLTHEWYDNLDDQDLAIVREAVYKNDPTPLGNIENRDSQNKAIRFLNLTMEVKRQPKFDNNYPRATSAYNQVSPKDTKQFPIQRVDVVIPQKDAGENILWQQDNLHENLPNTLGWAAIQYETLPNGEKVAHIFEAQSRWGQTLHKEQQKYAVREKNGNWESVAIEKGNNGSQSISTMLKAKTKEEAQAHVDMMVNEMVNKHPLLKDYNRLILKAAIEQARKEGATHIAISDAETAMMTEGHDAHLETIDVIDHANTKREAEKLLKSYSEKYPEEKYTMEYDNDLREWSIRQVEKRPSQENGMRLNYDKILPKIAEELTGDKGQIVSFGEHKNAFRFDVPGNTINSMYLRNNLIFKNQDGSPKTDVTARVYDISKVTSRRNANDKFTLFGTKFQDSPASIVPSTLKPEVEKIRAFGEHGKVIADTATSFYEKLRANRGEFVNRPIAELKKSLNILNPKEFVTLNNNKLNRVDRYLQDMSDYGKSTIVLSQEEQNIAKNIRQYLLDVRTRQNSIPHIAKTTAPNPNYYPETPKQSVIQKIINEPHTAEAGRLFKDFFDYYKAKGKTASEAKAELDKFKAGYSKRDTNIAAKFGPIDDSSGVGIPRSWRENNPIEKLSRYGERVARRFAFAESFENNPNAMKALTDGVYGLQGNTNVRSVMNDIYGFRPIDERKRNAATGIVKALMMGPLTGYKDLRSSITLGWQHQHSGQLLKSAMHSWDNIKHNITESFEAGVNRENFGSLEMSDIENTLTSSLHRTRDIINTAQGRNFLETVTRGFNYGQGKYLAMDNLFAYQKGKLSKQGEKFLNDFAHDMDWKNKKSFSPKEIKEIASRFVESVQGTYDYRGLPAISQEGSIAPYLALARWNIEKLNNFQKHVVAPALKGNYTPLLLSTIGMIGNGLLLQKEVEIITGKKQKTPTTEEVVQAFKDKDGNGISALTYKLAGLASISGYMGLEGDLAKSMMDMVYKNKPQMYNNVLIDALSNVGDYASDLVMAISEGKLDASIDIITQMLMDNVQSMRLVFTHLSKDVQKQNIRSDKFRDLKMFRNTHGLPVQDSLAERPNMFEGRTVRKFKQADTYDEAAELAPKVREGIRKNVNGSREVFTKNLRGARQNSYQTMPHPETSPLEYRKYYKHIKDTQGQAAADALAQDYYRQNALNKNKAKLVN